MHHNMRDGCTTRQDGVFPEVALLEIMDRYVEIVTMLFERFLRHSRRAAKGKARCSYMQMIVCGK